MSNLEAYIIKRYGRWIPFSVCSEELLFDVTDAIYASYTKECEACTAPVNPETLRLTPKLKPVKYDILKYTMPFEHIDYDKECLLFTALAKLLLLNMHLQGEQL